MIERKELLAIPKGVWAEKIVPKPELGNEESTLFLFRSGRYRGGLGCTGLGFRGLGRRFFLWGSR
jgi:hypothetical protein